jgi:hypothetical protein
MSTSPPQTNDDKGNELTPNTLAEAESAFLFNSTLQTSSAGKPQPTTPLPSTEPHSNYLSAASAAGLAFEPPFPDDVPLEHVRSLPALSRGTTQAVLQKMDSGSSVELGRRGSKEGAKRTSMIKMPGEGVEGKDGAVDGVGGASATKPSFDRKQSWNKEDLKRVMSERLMTEVDGSGEAAGYDSEK